jgi:guanylate cyclase soluble subunit beta
MYGWIHECLKGMIISTYGHEIWNEIILKSGLKKSTWNIQEYAPDSVFYILAETASEVIGIHSEQLSEMYGRYFLDYVHQQGHERLLRCLGKNLFEWLSNVNQVHQHLLYAMSHMRPPNIW